MIKIKENQRPLLDNNLTDIQKLEESLTAMITECSDNIAKWVASVLSFTLPTDSFQLNSAINKASEEILRCRLNIVKSVDEHVFVGKEVYTKKQKINKHKDQLQNKNIISKK